MSFLIDTHVLVWWFRNDPRLSERARTTISSSEAPIIISSVSTFEIATKVRLGKFEEARVIEANFRELVDTEEFDVLPVTATHSLLAGRLNADHRDPFDRLLAAQARVERLVFITRDPAFAGFGVETLW